MSARRLAPLSRLPLLALALAPLLIQPALAEPASTKAKLKSQSAQPLLLKRKALPSPEAVPGVAGGKLGAEAPGRAAVESRAQRLRELDQARGLKDIKDLPLGPAQMPERSGGLTDIPGSTLGQRDGRRIDPMERLGRNQDGGFENPLGKYAPDLPSNHRGRGHNPLVPSANPRDWMTGSAGQDSRRSFPSPELNAEESAESRRHGGLQRRSDGRPRVTGGVTGNPNAWTRDRQVHYNDGSMRSMYQEHRDGVTVTIHKGPDGSVDKSDTEGHFSTAPGRSGGGIDRTLDPDAPSEEGVALLCYAVPWQCGEIDGPDVGRGTLVNPGPVEAQGGFLPGPRIDPGQGIVVNPAPDTPAQADNWEAGRRLLEEGPQVPHSEPGDPRGER